MKSNRGFTLIELMIVVVIIAILAGIAYPSYDEYVKRGNRTEGQALLSEAAATQERYFSQNNTYITTQADIGKLHMRNTSGTTVKSSTEQIQPYRRYGSQRRRLSPYRQPGIQRS